MGMGLKISVAPSYSRGNQWRRVVVDLIRAVLDHLSFFQNGDLNVFFPTLLFQLQYHSIAKMTTAGKTIKMKLVPAFWTLI